MGKYSSFRNQITQFTTEPDRQDKVNNQRREIHRQLEAENKAITMGNLGHVLVRARLEKQRLEELVKEQNLIIEAMNQELVETLEEQDYTSLRLNNGISLTIKDDVYCSVEDRTTFNNWIKETGQEVLFTVNYQTMAALSKNLLIEGKEVPPGIGVYFKQSIIIRGMKGLDNGDE